MADLDKYQKWIRQLFTEYLQNMLNVAPLIMKLKLKQFLTENKTITN